MSMSMTKRIGRFDIVEPIGQGLTGTVYKGFDPTTGRNVTVETIALDGLRDEASREEALKAARDAGVLSHPNIALILDVGSDAEVAFVVREFIDGRTLADHIVEGAPFQPAALLPGLDQIADALDYAHRRGIIHGNFEPSHVVVSNLGQVKITGFGIARIASKIAQSAHALDGSPEYMAPEKIRGEAIGPRSDIYAFGAMVYELLTGRAPFAADSVVTTIFKSVNEPPVPPRSLCPDLSPRVDALVLKALAKSPTDRFENCRQFVDQLRAILRPDDTPFAAPPVEAAAPRFCDQCGTALRPKDDVCYRCGAAPNGEQVAAAPELEPAPAPKAVVAPAPAEPAVVSVAPPPVVAIPEPEPVVVPVARVVPPTEVVPAPPVVAPRIPKTEVAPAPPLVAPSIPKTEVVQAPDDVAAPGVPPPPAAKVEPRVEARPAPPPVVSPDLEPARRMPAPLSGYAESVGEDLPAPGEVIDAAPRKPSFIMAMLPWLIIGLILFGFLAFGFWLAPKILKPVPAPQQQTSAVATLGADTAGTRI